MTEFTGAEQAVADINAKGGIKGNKLQIVKYDDACDPKQAVAVANKVVNDGIKYVIGHLCSSSTQPASDIYEDEGILMITPAATAPELTARGYQLILRTTGTDSDRGPTAAKYILESETAAYCYRSRQTAIRRRSGASGAGRPEERQCKRGVL